ncbi:MAG: hypothetical protein LBO09_04855 [Candidatus Peribacteria bacterium]|jgi:hypothetical protein|nr:hypothetical protein [Candidatus Peribacteria bacterium]
MILNIEDFNPRGEYSPHQQDLLNERKSQLEIDFLDLTPFSDPDFLTKFEQKIPKQEQINYVINTNNYKVKNGYKKSLNYDPHYVLVTRRAIHTQAKKPEQYWTDEHRVARFGLNQEIPK